MDLFLTAFGVTGTFASLYDSISKRLKDDNKDFRAQLRKHITAICKAASETLSESFELMDIIPPDADEIIYSEVIKALETQKKVDIDEIKKRLCIPRNDVFENLIKIIDTKLHDSFEYCQRDYIAWSRCMLNEIKSDTGQILQILESKNNPMTREVPRTRVGSNLPFSRNNYFTGRDQAFKDICTGFESGNAISLTQIIEGMGGLGKTQTALEYAYRYASKYKWIWWVHAETEVSVIASYKQFAVKMGLVDEAQHDGEAIIEAVLNWMDSNDGWLFIYDNADNISGDTRWWPRDNRGNILITTRNKHNFIGEKVDIDVFTEEESIEFLKKRTGINEDSVTLLANRLGYLPLALEQAAAYIVTNKITYAEYLSLFDDEGLELLEEVDGVDYYSLPVTATLEISIKKIDQEAARQLLYLCAYMAPEDIDEALFIENAELLPLPLGEAIQKRLKSNKVWKTLDKYSLLKKQEDGNGYSMHRLLQEVVRNSIMHEQQWMLCCLSVFTKTYDFIYGDIASQNKFSKLTPHVEAFLSTADSNFTDDGNKKEIVYLYDTGGFGFNRLGYYNRALQWRQKALVICEEVLGFEHPYTAATYNSIALIYDNQGDYPEALEWYKKALGIYEEVLGLEHPETATIYNNIAVVYGNQGDYHKALELLQKALKITEKVLGLEHPSTATTYNNIAVVYSNQGDYPKALEWYQKDLKITEKVLGLEHPETATTYNNIAVVYGNQGDYPKALEWHQKALEIFEKVLGLEHPNTIVVNGQIAAVRDLLNQ